LCRNALPVSLFHGKSLENVVISRLYWLSGFAISHSYGETEALPRLLTGRSGIKRHILPFLIIHLCNHTGVNIRYYASNLEYFYLICRIWLVLAGFYPVFLHLYGGKSLSEL